MHVNIVTYTWIRTKKCNHMIQGSPGDGPVVNASDMAELCDEMFFLRQVYECNQNQQGRWHCAHALENLWYSDTFRWNIKNCSSGLYSTWKYCALQREINWQRPTHWCTPPDRNIDSPVARASVPFSTSNAEDEFVCSVPRIFSL